MTHITLRPAHHHDIEQILAIYAHYVMHSTATYEETVPTLEEYLDRYQSIVTNQYPFWLAVEKTKILGFAYLNQYNKRSAFRFTTENTIYLHPDACGQGVGSLLMKQLLQSAQAGPWQEVIAVIGSTDNMASIKLHEKFGFQPVGILKRTGYKFERWIDTVIMQKSLR